jgi:hypothetical protein
MIRPGPQVLHVRVIEIVDAQAVVTAVRDHQRRELALARLFRSLDADLVVPFEAADDARGFLALGGKRSGDVFTNTDVSLLAGIAVQLSLRHA